MKGETKEYVNNPFASPIVLSSEDYTGGMTMLDVFAARVLPTVLSRYNITVTEERQDAAAYSYAMAMDMLKEREKYSHLFY